MSKKQTPTKRPAGTRAKQTQAKAEVKHAVSPEQIEQIRRTLSAARFATAPVATTPAEQVAQLQSALKLCHGAMDKVHELLLHVEGKSNGAGTPGGSGDSPS